MSNTNSEVEKSSLTEERKFYDELFRSAMSLPASVIAEADKTALLSEAYQMDGNSSSPEMPFADPVFLLEQFNQNALYITRYEKEGRPLPNAFALYELSDELSSLASRDSNVLIEDFVDNLVELIDEHCDYYGFMFTQDVFEDLGDFKHMQSCIAVPSQGAASAESRFTPIMGLNGAYVALKRLEYARENPGQYAGNTLIASCDLVDEDLASENAFNYLYCGHLSLMSTLQHHSDIDRAYEAFLSPEDEDFDVYADQLAAVYVTVPMNCLQAGSHYKFHSTLSETPFVFWGYSDIPTMWLSIIISSYISNSDLASVAGLASKYQDIFAFLLASASGLPLSSFQSLKGRRSSFHELSKTQKRNVLMDLAHLADDACLKMQSSEFLFTTPLINLYELYK